MKTRILTIIAAIFLLSACDKDKPADVDFGYCEYYVQWFKIVDDIEYVSLETPPAFGFEHYCFVIRLGGESFSFRDSGKKLKQYKEICHSLGDTGYGKTKSYYSAVFDELTSIDIRSNVAFDENHPANSSLNDIVVYNGQSVYKSFVERDEQQSADYDPRIYKYLTELTLDDLKMTSHYFELHFLVDPPKGSHTFTITIKSADKTFTYQGNYELTD